MPVPWSTYRQHVQSFWRYFYSAQTRYDVHSPFLSKWVEAVLEDRRDFYIFDEAEIIRHYWLNYVQQEIDFTTDHGAGSRAGQGGVRSVKDIVRTSAVDPETARRLFRIAHFHQPKTILELGTNLGMSALYLQAACKYDHFITIEGHPALANLAKASFERAKKPLPDLRIGTFADLLPKALNDLKQVDLAWIDGDHRYEPTIRYFEQLLPYLTESSVVIIGDIHWSEEMSKAWKVLQNHKRVTLSVDLYHLGVLFFRPQQLQSEHFTLIPQRYKPWRLGFF